MSVSVADPTGVTAEVESRPPWALAWRLALGQMIAWGVLFYAFTVVVGPMQAGTGWSRTFLNGGLSLGLLVWGIWALPVGSWIQRRGGRGLMATASGVGGAALILMGAWPHPGAYLIAWVLLGMGMAGMLYDAAFAVVTAAFGSEYRRGITLITLVGGLASTVFIPLAQLAVDRLGWQSALMALGAGQIAVGVPLHAWGIPRRAGRGAGVPALAVASTPQRLRAWGRELGKDISDPRFVGLALWFTAHAAAFTGLIFHLVPILQQWGVESATILQAIALIGPMQVLGRFWLTTRGNHFSTVRVGYWAMAGLFVAVGLLAVLPPRFVGLALFATLYGASNGVLTILRGTAISEFFGRERYAELNGALSAPAVLAKAAAPLALAGLWTTRGEPRAVLIAVLAFVGTGTFGLVLASRAQARRLQGLRAA